MSVDTNSSTEAKQKLNDAQDKVRAYLIGCANQQDGWWGYKSAQSTPSLEATAWAALSMLGSKDWQSGSGTAEQIRKALAFLAKSQNKDGGFSTAPNMGLPSNWVTGPTMLALRRLTEDFPDAKTDSADKAIKKGLQYLTESRVEFFAPVARLLILISQGPDGLRYSRGWPWDQNCFHWVEPTSYNLLALKVPGLPANPYIDQVIEIANKFLLEHPCRDGGWNHGNNVTLGAYLPPYRVTTAEALLALQEIKNNQSIDRGLAFLTSLASQNTSSMALAWSILALNAYGKDASKETAMLLARQRSNGSFGDNIMIDGLSSLALQAVAGKNQLKYSLDLKQDALSKTEPIKE